MSYQINTIYLAIQGEGCLTGVPMVLVRLQGCSVHCPWCDTKETWRPRVGGRQVSVEELIGQVQGINATGWILLTGGEPAEQPLEPLVIGFHDAGYRVALETSGTADGCLGVAFDWVCVSPKLHKPILPDVMAQADEVKMVICKASDIEDLDDLLEQSTLKEGCQICLQPVSQSPTATKLCIDTVQERGWRLSVQVHKYLDLP